MAAVQSPKMEVEKETEAVKLLEEPDEDTLVEMFSPELLREWKQCKSNKISFDQFMNQLFITKRLNDAILSVKDGSGGVEGIKAHKCILKHNSDFFLNSFSERWVSGGTLDLTSYPFTVAEFNCFLQFLYTGKTKITKDNVMVLYQIATMICVESFQAQLETYIGENCVDEENVLTVFRNVSMLKDKSALMTTLTDYIRSKGSVMLEKPEMMAFTQDQLKIIFRRKIDKTTGLQAFRFCFKWAEKTLGRKILYEYEKLDEMFQDEFSMRSHYGANNWFGRTFRGEDEESQGFPSLRDSFHCETPVGNSSHEIDLSTVYTVKRFARDRNEKWYNRRNHFDKISVRFSQTVILTGVGLYGDVRYGKYPIENLYSLEPAKYSVNLKVYYDGKPHMELYNSEISDQGTNLTQNIYSVAIESPPSLVLLADVWYTVAVEIKGWQETWRGADGVKGKLVKCGALPVLVEFREANQADEKIIRSNATGVPLGQIPELHFKLANDGGDDDIEILTA